MVSTQHLIKDQITGRHAGGLRHGINPFTQGAGFASASFGAGGCPSCSVGSMSNAGVGLNGYINSRQRGGCPPGCRCGACG